MSVRYIRPPNPLAAKLLAATPLSTEMALKRAQSNLASIADECLAEIDQNLAGVERLFGMWPEAPDAAYMTLLYEQGLRIYGVASVAGLPRLDEATYSFCDVVDGQIATSAWNRDPVGVHVGAMRLLRSRDMPAQDAKAILDGLAHVRKRFAPPKPKPAEKGAKEQAG